MDADYLSELFGLQGKVAVITGGGGVLCSEMARGLARAGARIALLGLHEANVRKVADEIRAQGGEAIALECDVLDKAQVEAAAQQVLADFGQADILINGAGGTKPGAITGGGLTFFDLSEEAFRSVLDLNFIGSLLPCQVFGKRMAEQKEGVILNIASMSSFRPLTRVPAYSAAKAAIANFTQWLATHMAQEYSPHIRVNAIAPGFLLAEQNRRLLTDPESGALTERGQKIIQHTPLGRFLTPDELVSTVIWLVSPGARAVSGITVAVDGGFTAYCGV